MSRVVTIDQQPLGPLRKPRQCPRCHRVAVGWRFRRADVCSPAGWVTCLRWPQRHWAIASGVRIAALAPLPVWRVWWKELSTKHVRTWALEARSADAARRKTRGFFLKEHRRDRRIFLVHRTMGIGG